MAQFPAWNIEAARELILRLRDREGAALPMLHALQDTFGYVDREALPLIAETLNLSKAEVYGTLTKDDPAFSETNRFEPNSPYSASKASSDHLVRAYHHTYGLPVLTTNCSNNY